MGTNWEEEACTFEEKNHGGIIDIEHEINVKRIPIIIYYYVVNIFFSWHDLIVNLNKGKVEEVHYRLEDKNSSM